MLDTIDMTMSSVLSCVSLETSSDKSRAIKPNSSLITLVGIDKSWELLKGLSQLYIAG